jgi:hypothetical protein
LHKLLISQECDVNPAGKKSEDLLQAKAMIELLKEDRPGDLEFAREALAKRGASWSIKVKMACDQAGVNL